MAQMTTNISTKEQEVLDRWEEIKNAPEVEITDELRAEVLDKIIVARVGLLLRHPFFGNMATRLVIKEATDWCPTAATDGRHLFYSVPFFAKMSNKEVEFVIAHEILHCGYDHMTRREDRDAMLHNIAADYIVNNTLVRDNIGTKPADIPIFQDFKYDGKTSEEVYDEIYKKYDEENEAYDGKYDGNDKLEYYKRIGTNEDSKVENLEKWVYDDKITQEKLNKMELFTQNNCEDKLKCYPEDSVLDLSCVGEDTKINAVNDKLLKEMEMEYYKKHYKAIDDMEDYQRKYEVYIKKLESFSHG